MRPLLLALVGLVLALTACSSDGVRFDRGLALTHNLGGYPGEMVSFVGIWGSGTD